MKNIEDKILLYAPIEKTDEEQHMVYGYASTEAVDSQGEIVKKDALKGALADYMKFANIREMHQPSAVGKTKKAQIDNKGLYIAAKIVDPAAWEKVKEGVYSGFSIGGHVKQMVDNEITDLRLSEISLVDRPANPEATFDVFKADGIVTKDEIVTEEILPEAKDIIVDEPKEEVIEEKKSDEPEMVKANPASESISQLVAYNGSLHIAHWKANTITNQHKALGDLYESMVSLVDEFSEIYMGKYGVPSFPAFAIISDITANPVEAGLELVERLRTLFPAGQDDDLLNILADMSIALNKCNYLLKEVPSETVEANEPVSEEKDEFPVMAMADDKETLLKSIDESINAGLMPSDEQIDSLFKMEGIEKDERSLSVFKYTMAGKILDAIETNMKNQDEKALIKKDLERLVDEAEIITAKSENEFTKAIELVDELMKGTTAEAPTLPEAESPRYEGSGENAIIAQMVELLSRFNAGNALTEDEKKLLADGISMLSMRFPGGNLNTKTEDITEELHPKADFPELKKMESEIELLKAEIEKMNNMPEPIKVKAAYAVIEKAEVETDPKEELAKAMKEVDQVSEELRLNPNDPKIINKAKDLSLKVMKLQRNQG